jgi:hypothetical protein
VLVNGTAESGLKRASVLNPDSAVEREVMSKEQTFRSEDNASCKQMELRASPKKDFETKQSSVFATPGLPLAHFLAANPG